MPHNVSTIALSTAAAAMLMLSGCGSDETVTITPASSSSEAVSSAAVSSEASSEAVSSEAVSSEVSSAAASSEAPLERTVAVNRFVEGDTDFTSVDNLAFQPSTGHLYAIEDHKNGDVWACLKDGADRDIKTDGCIRLLAVKDQSAEPTGFMFSPDGMTAYVNIQHSNDTGIALVDGYATDDLVKITGFAAIDATMDFGKAREDALYAESATYFGFTGAKSVGFSDQVDRNTTTDASEVIDLADGLSAEFLTRNVGNKIDMGDFYPYGDNPTHMVFCVEGGSEDLDNGKKNPSVQSIDLTTGDVSTILRGMSRCDGLRTTAWGTIVATEEAGATGAAYEIIDPLNVSEHTILDRDSGLIVDENNETSTVAVKRDALPAMSWEGFIVTEAGVIIGGDELRPGTDADDADGGAIFKFIPETPRTETGDITDLAQSPLTAGSVYAMQVSCRDSKQQFGQGCEIGNGAWIEVTASDARAEADAKGATGYYRPEDLHLDPTYTDEGIRFCWANTGNEGAQHFGEVICGIDTLPLYPKHQ